MWAKLILTDAFSMCGHNIIFVDRNICMNKILGDFVQNHCIELLQTIILVYAHATLQGLKTQPHLVLVTVS